MHETYYTPSSKGAKLPVKWMAPEVYNYAAATKFNLLRKSGDASTVIVTFAGTPVQKVLD